MADDVRIPWPAYRDVRDLGDDHLDWLTRLVYHPVFGIFYRSRYRDPYRLIRFAAAERSGTGRRAGRVLELGFGAGFFLPVLARRFEAVCGVDLPEVVEKVRPAIARRGLGDFDLRSGEASRIPFEDDAFDCVVAISVLEHVPDLAAAMEEVRRVLAPGGSLVFGVPTKSPLARALFRAIGFDHRTYHPNSDEAVLRAAEARFARREVFCIPRAAPVPARLYVAARYRKE